MSLGVLLKLVCPFVFFFFLSKFWGKWLGCECERERVREREEI